MSEFWRTCNEFLRYYSDGMFSFWKTLGPGRYCIVLGVVWAAGVLLLKSGTKRV